MAKQKPQEIAETLIGCKIQAWETFDLALAYSREEEWRRRALNGCLERADLTAFEVATTSAPGGPDDFYCVVEQPERKALTYNNSGYPSRPEEASHGASLSGPAG